MRYCCSTISASLFLMTLGNWEASVIAIWVIVRWQVFCFVMYRHRSSCLVEGEIPESLGKLTSLRELRLCENKLQGKEIHIKIAFPVAHVIKIAVRRRGPPLRGFVDHNNAILRQAGGPLWQSFPQVAIKSWWLGSSLYHDQFEQLFPPRWNRMMVVTPTSSGWWWRFLSYYVAISMAGKIPESLGDLINVTHIFLDNNMLEGTPLKGWKFHLNGICRNTAVYNRQLDAIAPPGTLCQSTVRWCNLCWWVLYMSWLLCPPSAPAAGPIPSSVTKCKSLRNFTFDEKIEVENNIFLQCLCSWRRAWIWRAGINYDPSSQK